MGQFVFMAFWGVAACVLGYVFFSRATEVSRRAQRQSSDVLNSPRGIKVGGVVMMVAGPVAIAIAVVNLLAG